MKNGIVVYEFKDMVNLNKFLKDHAVRQYKSLGLLKKNRILKTIRRDREGFFRLFSADPTISKQIGIKQKFKLRARELPRWRPRSVGR